MLQGRALAYQLSLRIPFVDRWGEVLIPPCFEGVEAVAARELGVETLIAPERESVSPRVTRFLPV